MTPDFDGMMRELQSSLCLLAISGRDALDMLPDGCVKADELALNYDHWLQIALTNCGILFTETQRDALMVVDRLLDEMSGKFNAQLWTDEEVRSHHRWAKVRTAAQDAANSMGWTCLH